MRYLTKSRGTKTGGTELMTKSQPIADELLTQRTESKESMPPSAVKSADSDERSANANNRKVKSEATEAVDDRRKDFLTEAEMKRFLDAARSGRHGVRDYVMMLMAYRHGLRVSELIDIRINDLDLSTARLFVRRKKG